SGHFDDYNTPHWLQWYKQTRAHNAVTFDGGQGQTVFEETGRLGPGMITGYLQRPDYDIVSGDATQAYGGALKEARRSLVYLRPNLAIVYDRLASDIPRRWEWNIHALNAMTVLSEQRISIHNDPQSLCVDMLAGPAVQFAQTDLFTADPGNGAPRQWHGSFHSVAPLASTEFIALLNVGCVPTAASASKANGVWSVQVGEKTITIAADGSISVGAAPDTTPPTVGITAPAPGAVVSGTVTVTAATSDNVGVVGVQFKYNDVNFGTEATSAPYSTPAVTTDVPNGTYTLTAVARDAAGNTTTSAPVTITVSNP
ncbi:MAG: Ig-like domain-containing protein, partial [Burkholderiales bacterium]